MPNSPLGVQPILFCLLNPGIDHYELRNGRPGAAVANIYTGVVISINNPWFYVHHGFMNYLATLEIKYAIQGLLTLDGNAISIKDFTLLFEQECCSVRH